MPLAPLVFSIYFILRSLLVWLWSADHCRTRFCLILDQLLIPFLMKLRLHRYVNKVPAREEIKQVFLRDIKAMPYVKVLEVLLIAPPHNRRMTVTCKFGDLSGS